MGFTSACQAAEAIALKEDLWRDLNLNCVGTDPRDGNRTATTVDMLEPCAVFKTYSNSPVWLRRSCYIQDAQGDHSLIKSSRGEVRQVRDGVFLGQGAHSYRRDLWKYYMMRSDESCLLESIIWPTRLPYSKMDGNTKRNRCPVQSDCAGFYFCAFLCSLRSWRRRL